MPTTLSGPSRRPARTRRVVALVLAGLVLVGLGTPVAAADATPPTAVDRFLFNGYGASLDILLIGHDVAGSAPEFTLSGTTSGSELHLIGGPECYGGTCTQLASYSSPDADPGAGSDSFTYSIASSAGASDPATVNVSYAARYARPHDQLARLSPKTAGTVGFFTTAPHGHQVKFWPSSLPMRGTLGPVSTPDCNDTYWPGAWTCSASASFTPDPGLTSRDSDEFYWQVEDLTTGDFSATAYTVMSFENSPIANDDSFTVPNDRTSTIDVFANDSDPDGDALTLGYDQPVQHGVLNSCTPVSCTYTPEAGYVGQDSFTYNINDGQRPSQMATVTITVTDPPPAPPAPPAPTGPTCKPGTPTVRSAAPGARGGALTAVVAWSVPTVACAGAPTRFTITASKLNARGAVVATRAYTAAGSARRLEMRLPTARRWRFQVAATNARGTSAKSRASVVVVAR